MDLDLFTYNIINFIVIPKTLDINIGATKTINNNTNILTISNNNKDTNIPIISNNKKEINIPITFNNNKITYISKIFNKKLLKTILNTLLSTINLNYKKNSRFKKATKVKKLGRASNITNKEIYKKIEIKLFKKTIFSKNN